MGITKKIIYLVLIFGLFYCQLKSASVSESYRNLTESQKEILRDEGKLIDVEKIYSLIKSYKHPENLLYEYRSDWQKYLNALLIHANKYNYPGYKFDIDKPFEGQNLLQLATEENRPDVIQTLLNHKSNIEFKDDAGDTPLILSAYKNNIEAAETLIANGANVNAQNNNGTTALHISLRQNNNNFAKILLEAGAQTSIRNNTGQTAENIAIKKNNLEILKIINKRKHELKEVNPNIPAVIIDLIAQYDACEVEAKIKQLESEKEKVEAQSYLDYLPDYLRCKKRKLN